MESSASERARLNRWLADVVAAHPPPAVSGRRIRLDYVTQPKSRPPTFVLFMSRADAVPDAYRRYLVNSLRESFALPGTPIRLMLREKKNPYGKRSRGPSRDVGLSLLVSWRGRCVANGCPGYQSWALDH